MAWRRASQLALVLAFGVAACSAGPSVSHSANPPRHGTPAQHAASVAVCPVPTVDARGSEARLSVVPKTVTLNPVVSVPTGATIYGSNEPSEPTYLVGPSGWTCSAWFASADGGYGMEAVQAPTTSNFVYELLNPGGIGPTVDDACPYIEAARAAARSAGFVCSPAPSGETSTSVSVGIPGIYAAIVRVPGGVKDANFLPPDAQSSPSPWNMVALVVASVKGDQVGSQLVSCSLPGNDVLTCPAAIELFLTQTPAASHEVVMKSVTTRILAIVNGVMTTRPTVQPATVPPLVPECSVPIFEGQVPWPLICADGGININAWKAVAVGPPFSQLLTLGRGATRDEIQSATCANSTHYPNPVAPVWDPEIIQATLTITNAYFGWALSAGTQRAILQACGD